MLEGNIVVEFSTLAEAFVMLFALMYALHFSYPKRFDGLGGWETEAQGVEP